MGSCSAVGDLGSGFAFAPCGLAATGRSNRNKPASRPGGVHARVMTPRLSLRRRGVRAQLSPHFRGGRSEVERGPQRPHRPSVSRKQPADDSLITVVAVEVEESESVVAMDADVSAWQDLEADAGVPAKLSVGDPRIGWRIDHLERPAIPAGSAQQVWSRAAVAEAHEERRLYRGLGDFDGVQ